VRNVNYAIRLTKILLIQNVLLAGVFCQAQNATKTFFSWGSALDPTGAYNAFLVGWGGRHPSLFSSLLNAYGVLISILSPHFLVKFMPLTKSDLMGIVAAKVCDQMLFL